jgi:hypothetical protein
VACGRRPAPRAGTGHDAQVLVLPDDLRKLVVAQDGLVTRRQCLEHGVSRRQVDRLAQPGGRGQRVLPRVYALTTGEITRRQQLRAALLYGGDGCVLAGVTVLELMRFRYAPVDVRVHLLVPHGRRVVPHRAVELTRTRRLPQPLRVEGLPVSPAERAVVDACRGAASIRDAVAVLAEAVQRRACTLDALQQELSRGHSAGSAQVRRALGDIARGVWSAPENDLAQVLALSTVLPPARLNYPVDVDGHRYLGDACWPEVRLIVEVDSVEHHGVGPAAEATARRRNALVAAGWTVLSMAPHRLRQEPTVVLAEVEAAYLSAAERQAS